MCGYIERIAPTRRREIVNGIEIPRGMVAYANEEGLIHSLEFNRIASAICQQSLVGPVIFVEEYQDEADPDAGTKCR